MKEFVRSVCEVINRRETFTMATVVESTGSTPRSSGAKMAVRADGSIIGTVGGGLVEAEACSHGQALINNENGSVKLMHVDMTQELAANSDMICGGGLTLLLEKVAPDNSCARAYKLLDNLLRKGRKSVLRSTYEDRASLLALEHAVIVAEDDMIDNYGATIASGVPTFTETQPGMELVEPFIPPSPLYIFGAGHVSLFTAKLASMAGFRTVVLDDRDDFANEERFPEVDEVRVLDSFEKCCADLTIGKDASIIIVTRGHLHDRTVLHEALQTKAGYVGMIGSRKKRDAIYESLLRESTQQEDIDRCHCPIGLNIGAVTPEEIAVSIMAEVIQVRSGVVNE